MRKQVRAVTVALMATLALSLGGCGYNTFQTTDEQVKAGWAEVINQYQRRADLIPNLVNTVKGEAKFEQDTLTKVIEARAKATSIQATPELINDPAAFQKFQQAQGELTGALSRLMVVSEQYPNLRANQGFRDLSAQLATRRASTRMSTSRPRSRTKCKRPSRLTRPCSLGDDASAGRIGDGPCSCPHPFTVLQEFLSWFQTGSKA